MRTILSSALRKHKENLASAKRWPRTRTGRSRLEHRQGWQDAVWPSVPVAMDGEKGPFRRRR